MAVLRMGAVAGAGKFDRLGDGLAADRAAVRESGLGIGLRADLVGGDERRLVVEEAGRLLRTRPVVGLSSSIDEEDVGEDDC